MKKVFCTLILFLSSVLVFSQAKAGAFVYVMNIRGGTAEEQAFFLRNLKMEIPAGGYRVTEDILVADYALSGSIIAAERGPGRILRIALFNAREEREIASVDIPFNVKEETYELLPFLLWSMFPEAPLVQVTAQPDYAERESGKEEEHPKEEGKENEPDPAGQWKRKWVFLNARLGLSSRFYPAALSGQPGTMAFTFDGGIEPEIDIPVFSHFLSFQTGIDIALDKLEYKLSPTNPMPVVYSTYILSVPAMAKFIFNTSPLTSLGTYLGVYYSVPLFGVSKPPPLGLLVGLDFNYKTGPGALLFDLRYSIDLGSSSVSNSHIVYNRMFITLSAGYKLGFFKHKR